MRSKKQIMTHFSRAQFSESLCFRPDKEQQLKTLPVNSLARGSGLSYSDCCFNTNGYVIDTRRLNHFIDFDENTGVVVCQAGLPLQDLFLLHPNFSPPVLPGTLHVSVGGAIANDVHGKNNPIAGSFGQHVLWVDLLLGTKILRCSLKENTELFHATLGGLGLTGVILRAGIQLKKTEPFVQVERKKYQSLESLMEAMSQQALLCDYQVAWLDLLGSPKSGLLSLAKHCQSGPSNKGPIFSIPKIPFSLIQPWNMKLFNRLYFMQAAAQQILSVQQFNNPLDSIAHWNRLYGSKGLLQFQALFPEQGAQQTLTDLMQLIEQSSAKPMLSVLKLFTKSGAGLLSFCKPGFSLAIDFMNKAQSVKAIKAMNQYISELGGRIYLAKDLFLTQKQSQNMYPQLNEFKRILNQNSCSIHSDLSKRLGIAQ